MPDFNFLKGNSKRDERTSAADSRQQPTGQQRPVAAHLPGEHSDATSNAPERVVRPAAPIAAAAGTGAAGTRTPGSVLDKYPQRDLSHLTGDPSATASTAHAATPVAGYGAEAAGSETTAGPGQTDFPETPQGESTTVAEGTVSNSSGKGPLITILGIVLLLVLIAFIWHVNPWPPLKDSISGFFSAKKETPASAVKQSADQADANDAVPAMRSWDYFIQVSSWRELGKADLDAERFRAQSFPVIVESEFLAGKGGTWYRVRIGPFESSADAREQLAASSGILPNGAYVDSVRLAEDMPLIAPAKTEAPANTEARRQGETGTVRGGAAQDIDPARLPGKDFAVVDEPMSGYAVKVSSLQNVDIARAEARKLLQQGYPSFITRKNVGGSLWYRVLVGPFSDKRDADRYQQLLNVTYGNDAYTVNLAAD